MPAGNISAIRVDHLQAQDYYAFGAAMEGRSFSISSYRFGFQGMEKEGELYGDGNAYYTQYRMLDVRIGRWFSTDPVVQPWMSPYSAFDNNPIFLIDPLGLKAIGGDGDGGPGGCCPEGQEYIDGAPVMEAIEVKGERVQTSNNQSDHAFVGVPVVELNPPKPREQVVKEHSRSFWRDAGTAARFLSRSSPGMLLLSTLVSSTGDPSAFDMHARWQREMAINASHLTTQEEQELANFEASAWVMLSAQQQARYQQLYERKYGPGAWTAKQHARSTPGFRAIGGVINMDKQGRHLPGHRNYRSEDGRSFLIGDAQSLFDQYTSGNTTVVRVINDQKLVVDFGKIIGVYYLDKEPIGETRFGTIHFSKTGAHIVPANPNQF
ncbi:MAG: polymorphic toxin type 50 domain-containing protein [Sphingobacteriia bacterium]